MDAALSAMGHSSPLSPLEEREGENRHLVLLGYSGTCLAIRSGLSCLGEKRSGGLGKGPELVHPAHSGGGTGISPNVQWSNTGHLVEETWDSGPRAIYMIAEATALLRVMAGEDWLQVVRKGQERAPPRIPEKIILSSKG